MDPRLPGAAQALHHFPKQAAALATWHKLALDEEQIARAIARQSIADSTVSHAWDSFLKMAAGSVPGAPIAPLGVPNAPAAPPAPPKPAAPLAPPTAPTKPPIAPTPTAPPASAWSHLAAIPGRMGRTALGAGAAVGGGIANAVQWPTEMVGKGLHAAGLPGADQLTAGVQGFRQHMGGAASAGLEDVQNLGASDALGDHTAQAVANANQGDHIDRMLGGGTGLAMNTATLATQALPYAAAGSIASGALSGSALANSITGGGRALATGVTGSRAWTAARGAYGKLPGPVRFVANSVGTGAGMQAGMDTAAAGVNAAADAAAPTMPSKAQQAAEAAMPPEQQMPAAPQAPQAQHAPLPAVTRDTLKTMSPDEAAQRGQAADARIATLDERLKTMPAEQHPEEIKSICADKIAARCKLSGEDPAAWMQKMEQGNWTRDDIATASSTPGFMERAQQMGGDAVQAFKSMEPWQQGLLAFGVPMALFGAISSVFGEGGVGSMLMGLLGGGMAAGAIGNGGGPMANIGQHVSNIGQHIQGLMGAGPKTPAPPTRAPVMPQGAPAYPANSPLAPLMNDNTLSADEMKQIKTNPTMRQHMATAPAPERDTYVRAMLDGNPEMHSGLQQAHTWYGTFPDKVRDRAKTQFGLEPNELDGILDSYSRVGRS
jgi:hypothetical protein